MDHKNEVSGRDFLSELDFRFARSSGPGGQHVNKTESKVELRFHIGNSLLLSADEKEKLTTALKNRINQEGYLYLTCQISRSQLKNREIVTERFYSLISKALQKRKKRLPTLPSKSADKKRIEKKKQLSDKKKLRGKVIDD